MSNVIYLLGDFSSEWIALTDSLHALLRAIGWNVTGMEESSKGIFISSKLEIVKTGVVFPGLKFLVFI